MGVPIGETKKRRLRLVGGLSKKSGFVLDGPCVIFLMLNHPQKSWRKRVQKRVQRRHRRSMMRELEDFTIATPVDGDSSLIERNGAVVLWLCLHGFMIVCFFTENVYSAICMWRLECEEAGPEEEPAETRTSSAEKVPIMGFIHLFESTKVQMVSLLAGYNKTILFFLKLFPYCRNSQQTTCYEIQMIWSREKSMEPWNCPRTEKQRSQCPIPVLYVWTRTEKAKQWYGHPIQTVFMHFIKIALPII
jgi:hypothetical protein